MMKAKIWNFVKRQYYDYELPDGSTLYEDDMDKVINCACCGKKIIYGQSYTSRRIHGPLGMGYPVCDECYRKEWEDEQAGIDETAH